MQWIRGAMEELLPIVVFFGFAQYVSFTSGVAAMCVATVAMVVLARVASGELPRFAVASTIAVLLFALPTIVTGEAFFFQFSDTILDGLFAFILLGSALLKRPLLKPLFSRLFAITDEAWQILTVRWGTLFLVLAGLNEFIRVQYSTDVWSYYKLISTIGILLFGCYQFTVSAKYRIVAESNWLGLRR